MTDGDPSRPPGVRAADTDRDTTVARLQKALAEGRIDLDEFGQRASAAYAAVTTDELAVLLADLPSDAAPRAEIVGTRTPEEITSVFGDISLSVGGPPPQRASTVFGDVRIDLRALRTDVDRIDLHVSTVFGDIDVIVAEGVDAELLGRTVFGDRKVELAPLQRLHGTPRIVVHARAIFGDLKLRSLAPGENPSRWRALLERLAQGPRTPPALS